MKPKNSQSQGCQLSLGEVLIESFIDTKQELIILGDSIDWDFFCKEFGKNFDNQTGRPGLPTRLMVGLTYLKYLYGLSDEEVVLQFLQNPYWQYFCGFIYFQTKVPLEASSLTRFRHRLGEKGAERLLEQTLEVAKKKKFLKSSQMKNVIVDTTVQKKNISHPTDTKLINKARENLVKEAQKEKIKLRQTYKFKGKRESVRAARYFHAKQYKRGRASVKKQKVWLGRVIRDVKRKIDERDEVSKDLKSCLDIAQRVFEQERKSKNKIYSLHEPYVDCISKGKVHSPYEFGNKVSFTVSAKGSWILAAKSFFGNPFDGKTLKTAIKQTERLTRKKVKRIAVDRGYRGKVYHPESKETLVSGMKTTQLSLRRFLKRRSSIEPVIGHMKQEHRLGVNYLAGLEGDKFNPIISASAFNLKKLMKAFSWTFFTMIKNGLYGLKKDFHL